MLILLLWTAFILIATTLFLHKFANTSARKFKYKFANTSAREFEYKFANASAGKFKYKFTNARAHKFKYKFNSRMLVLAISNISQIFVFISTTWTFDSTLCWSLDQQNKTAHRHYHWPWLEVKICLVIVNLNTSHPHGRRTKYNLFCQNNSTNNDAFCIELYSTCFIDTVPLPLIIKPELIFIVYLLRPLEILVYKN